MPKSIPPRPYFTRRRVLVRSSRVPGVVVMQPIRERVVPRAELAERLWLIWAEALNADEETLFNDRTRHPLEFADLYEGLRDSLRRFDRSAERHDAVERHARRWLLRARDVEDSLVLAHIAESTDPAFVGPRLQMPLVCYGPEPKRNLVRVGPQHQDPAHVAALARRRLRYLKGWALGQIAEADGLSDWKVVQSSLRSWKILNSEVA